MLRTRCEHAVNMPEAWVLTFCEGECGFAMGQRSTDFWAERVDKGRGEAKSCDVEGEVCVTGRSCSLAMHVNRTLD